MSDAAATEDDIICAWCEEPGADDFAETLEDGTVLLHPLPLRCPIGRGHD